MTQADDEQRRRAERGRLVRELAGREHAGPSGKPVRVLEQTIRRWARDWRGGGFEALVPSPARVSARTPAEVLELAVALKREWMHQAGADWTSYAAEVARTRNHQPEE